MIPDATPVTRPDDPRVEGMLCAAVAGEDQIAQMLAATPRERLRCLLDMLAFEERAHRARVAPPGRWMPRFQPEDMLRALERHGVRYVIIGGVGSTLHGSGSCSGAYGSEAGADASLVRTSP